MKSAKFVAASVCFLAAAAGVLVVRAAPGPDGSAPKAKFSTLMVTPQRAQAARARQVKRAQIDVGTATPAASASKALSEADLHTLLDNMGLSPTTGTFTDGSKYEAITVDHGDYNYYFQVNLSPDTTYIWFTTWGGQIKDLNSSKVSNWTNLLMQQGSLWPGYFSFETTDNSITANLGVRNADMTPALMRTTIDTFMDNLSSTSAAWDTSKWTTATPATAPAATPAAPTAPSTN
jgi:hypothetical protein